MKTFVIAQRHNASWRKMPNSSQVHEEREGQNLGFMSTGASTIRLPNSAQQSFVDKPRSGRGAARHERGNSDARGATREDRPGTSCNENCRALSQRGASCN